MHSKKLIIALITMVLVVSCFSGCIFDDIFSDDSTKFSLKSWSISDDEGFPSLNIVFSCSDRVTLKLYDPDSSLVDSEFFLNGNDETILHLSSYGETIDSGMYSLKVYDKKNDKISTKTFLIDSPDLTILSCSQRWWEREAYIGGYSLMGLEMLVKNNGDTPVYPHAVEISVGLDIISGVVIPCVVLPGEIEYIDCFVYNRSAPKENSFTVSLRDRYNNVVSSGSFSFNVMSNVQVKEFSWKYKSYLNREIELPYLDFLYNYYTSVDRTQHEDYSVYVFDQIDDTYLEIVAESVMFGFSSEKDVDKINFVVSFVQNLKYREDCPTDDSYEYPRYPIETLFNNNTGGGDCEDKAILTAAILYYLGYDVALLRLPDHMAVGVSLSENALPSKDFFIDSYYFLETTTKGHEVGDIPEEWESPSELTVYPISSRSLLLHTWRNNTLTYYTKTDAGDFAKVTIFVENLGLETANNILIEGIFSTQTGEEYNLEQESISSLEPGMKESITIMVDIPKGLKTWFKTRVVLDGEVVDERESASPFFI